MYWGWLFLKISVIYNCDMPDKNTHLQRERVSAEGKRAFEGHKGRGYNPYTSSNQELAMIWWHGWDTAEEESQGDQSGPTEEKRGPYLV
jgi:hypothetical protein